MNHKEEDNLNIPLNSKGGFSDAIGKQIKLIKMSNDMFSNKAKEEALKRVDMYKKLLNSILYGEISEAATQASIIGIKREIELVKYIYKYVYHSKDDILSELEQVLKELEAL